MMPVELIEQKKLPKLEDIMRKRECKEVFFLFADMFLSHVVGVAFGGTTLAKLTISEMTTVSNEAVALLLLENYWDTWSTKNLVAYQKKLHLMREQI